MENDSDGDQPIVNEEGAEEVVVADLDKETYGIPSSTRPKRTNTGAGIERIQIVFAGKEYGAK